MSPAQASGKPTREMRPEPLSWKQWAILVFFGLEVVFYPFVIALKSGADPQELMPERLFTADNLLLQTWIGAMFIWVPVILLLGYTLGRKLWNHPDVVSFFHNNDVSPEEIPPIVGIFAPLSIVAAVLLIYVAVLAIYFFVITVPIYLFMRFVRKKGIRSFLGWVFRLVGWIAVRLKRMSYLGYVLPAFFGLVFAKWVSGGANNTARGSYVLILLQMMVLTALWRHIRTTPQKAVDAGGANKPMASGQLPLPTPRSQGPESMPLSVPLSAQEPTDQIPLPDQQTPQHYRPVQQPGNQGSGLQRRAPPKQSDAALKRKRGLFRR